MMEPLSNSDRTDMMLILGSKNNNRREAAEAYAARYPNRVHPAPQTFANLAKNLREFGAFRKPYDSAGRKAHATARDELIATAVVEDPHTSTRAISSNLGIPQSTVWHSLHKERFHPFHVTLNQALHGTDWMRRTEFCMFVREKLEGNPRFLDCLFMSDEATFYRDGGVNVHNAHYWSVENPHWMREAAHQVRWKTNVWCGIVGDRVLGPIFLGNMTAATYLDLLRTDVTNILEELPLATIANLHFQQDGASAHNTLNVRNQLDRMFQTRWIGRFGPIMWPPRSPDLSFLDFFLWGYLKERVYQTEPTDLQDLQNRIQQAVASVTPHMLANVRRSFQERIEACLAAGGWHFEHLLQ